MSLAQPKSKKSKTQKFTIDATAPVNDRVFDINTFAKFLNDRIKVDGVTHNLGNSVEISKESIGTVTIISRCNLSGRALKYLTKKYIKKQMLRDWIRVISAGKGVYVLKFYNVVKEDKKQA